MLYGKCFSWMVLMGSIVSISACEETTPGRAQAWIAKQQPQLSKLTLPPVPEIVDTPPAIYTGKALNPFSPERLSAVRGAKSSGEKRGVIFPESAESALVIIGFMTDGKQERLAMVKSGSQYSIVRKGDRIGELANEVVDVQDKGLLLKSEDLQSHWLLRAL